MTSSRPALKAHELSLHLRSGLFDSKQVLDQVSFELPEGAVMGLVGRNGAGKSSLLRCLLGLTAPDQGESLLLGCPSMALSDEVRERLGYVAQTPDLFGSLSGNDHLTEMVSIYRHFDQRRALSAAVRLDLPMGVRADKLSLGDQQKLSVVLALGHRPDLLIMDEPVASLDPLARRDFMRELFTDTDDQETPRSVLISSHLLTDLERVVTHVMFMQQGRIQLVDSWDALVENLRLIKGETAPADPGVIHTREVGNLIHALVDLRKTPQPEAWRQGSALRMDDLFEELNA